MAYQYAIQNDVKQEDKWCRKVLHNVQNEVRDFFTFDIRLIGSGDKRLVTQNGDGPFDLDYNLILQRDKKNLIKNPEQIKKIFMDAFKTILEKEKLYKYSTRDSSSVITLNLIDNNNDLEFSFDVAIIVEADDGYFYRLTNDKNVGRYIWNKIPSSKNYFERFQRVKNNNQWMIFKKRYLELKNMHLKRNEDIKSFSVFLETLNEF